MGFKSIQIITLMAVKNKKLIYTFYARFYILIKIFYSIHTQFIIYLTVITNSNLSIARDYQVFVLKKKIIFCFNYDKQRNCLTLKIHFLNNKNPFSIIKLS